MRRYATQAEIDCISNVNFKRNHICSMYTQHCDYTDPQGYLMEQLESNPKLLAWLFDDNSLIGKTYLSLDGERYEAFRIFTVLWISTINNFKNYTIPNSFIC